MTKIHEALAHMKPAHRQILYAAALETPYEEMAELLGIHKGTVKSRLNRARAELAKILFGTGSKQYTARTKN